MIIHYIQKSIVHGQLRSSEKFPSGLPRIQTQSETHYRISSGFAERRLTQLSDYVLQKTANGWSVLKCRNSGGDAHSYPTIQDFEESRCLR